MVRHAVYFDALSKIQDETSPEWRSTLAGLVVLRLVDDWLLYGPQVVTTDVTGLGTIRVTVNAVPEDHSVRGTLLGAVDAIEQAELAEIGLVVPHLLAYGNALVYSNLWQLALDVFSLVVEHTRELSQYSSSTIQAAGQIAYGYRILGQAEEATAAYTTLKTLATEAGDDAKRLVAERGFAKLAIARGDLPAAEAIFDAVLREAQELKLEEAYTAALSERSGVAVRRGQYEVGIRYAYQALSLTKQSAQRDRILNNIAAMFLGLGSWRTAQDAFLVNAVTAQKQHERWVATINLFEIAALYDHIGSFNSYLRELQSADLPPEMKGHFYILAGQGHARFGNIDEARNVLNQAIELASKYKFNALLFRAEKALDEANDSGKSQSQVTSAPIPESISDVAIALTDLRELAYAVK